MKNVLQPNSKARYIKYAFTYERCLNICLKPCLVAFSDRSMSPFIFQITFVIMTKFFARVADASFRIGGVMVKTIVEMHPTRKIAVVRKLFHFFNVYPMFKLKIYD